MADRRVKVDLIADVSRFQSGVAKAAASTKALGATVDSEMSAMGKAGEKGGGFLAEGISLGITRNKPVIVAAIAGGLALGAPAMIAGAGILFAGLGALAAAQTVEVREAWKDLGTDIREDAVADAAVLVPVFEGMADKIGDSFQRLRPEIRDAFEASAPLVDTFTDSITRAAELAMPGLVRTVQAGGPVMDGLARLLEDVGQGVSDFFDAVNSHGPAAGQAFEALGDIIGEALPLLGEFMGSGTELASMVLPPLADVLGVVAGVASRLGDVLPALVLGFAGLRVANSLGGMLTSAAAGMGVFTESLTRSATAGERVMTRVNGLGAFLGGPWGMALGAATLAIPSLVSGFQSMTGASDQAKQAQLGFADALRATKGAIDETSRKGAQNALIQADLVDVLNAAGIAGDDAVNGLLGQADAQDRVNEALQAYIAANPGGAHNKDAEAARQAREDYEELGRTYGMTREEAEFFATTQTALGGTLALTGEAAKASEEQARKAQQATEDWINTLAGVGAAFVDPLAVYAGLLDEKTAAEQAAAEATAASTASTSDSWRDYVGDVDVSLDELAVRLEEQIVSQENWRANILTITQRGGIEVGQAIAAMGTEGAGLAADMAVAMDGEFQHMADLIVTDTRLGGEEAAGELDRAMKIMDAIGAAGGGATARSIARELRVGVAEVAGIAAQYGITLANGVNPVLVSLGKPGINPRVASGFADGGFTGPGDKYQVAGVVHAGEYVLTKEQTARLGIDQIEAFANRGYAKGGFVAAADVPRPSSTAPYQPPISSAGDATMQRGFDEVRAWLAANLEPPQTSGGSSTGLLPIMAAARQYVMGTYGVRNIGGFANRNIAGTNVKSDHAMGKAIDIMTTDLGLGWTIANDFAFGAAHDQFRAENVIWQQSISSNGGRFSGMADRGSPTQNHRDHVHVDTYDQGGILAHGGFGVNLSGSPERVLDPRETVAYEAGMRSREFNGAFAGGGGGGGVSKTDARQYVNNIAVGPSPEAVARAVVERQRDMEFLHG